MFLSFGVNKIMGWVSLDSVSLDLLVFLCTFKKATPIFSPGYRLDFGCQYVFFEQSTVYTTGMSSAWVSLMAFVTCFFFGTLLFP